MEGQSLAQAGTAQRSLCCSLLYKMGEELCRLWAAFNEFSHWPPFNMEVVMDGWRIIISRIIN